jgi:Ni/Co efflux regulator RcnB
MDEALGRVFTEIERQVIEDYYGGGAAVHDEDDDDRGNRGGRGKGKGKKNRGNAGNGGDLPPGLANRDELPPGLERQLERNGTLPPGLAKRNLPDDLRTRLRDPDDGTDRQIVGTDVLLVDTATGVILDILRDVVTP